MVQESIYVVFDENDDGIINFNFFSRLRLSRHDDEVEERDESNKATAKSLPQGNLNQLEDTIRTLQGENTKNIEVKDDLVQEARLEVRTNQNL